MLDLFLTDPTDPVERAEAIADIEELRAMGPLCDCDRCCTDPTCCPDESWCPAITDQDDVTA